VTGAHPRPLRRAVLTTALGGLCVLVLLWGAGFAWFLRTALTERPPPPPADGIVAFTGGAGRVEAALRLLADGRAEQLLISGVGGTAEFSALARRAGVDPQLGPRVTLGRAAATTRGNAAETADWVADKKIRSLIVVTAGYHMPRALAELGRVLPGVALYPAPVLPAGLREGGEPGMLRLLAGEYSKWLAAEVGLSALDPHGALRADGPAVAGHGG
jgi:uncharacterized SAM-binding protein YcdF (DUF218 family)